MTFPLMLAASDGGLEAFGLLGALATLVIGIVWIVFPFIVISKFNTLIGVAAEARKEAREAQKELTTRLATTSQSASELLKAMQWMIDNWPSNDTKNPTKPDGGGTIYRLD